MHPQYKTMAELFEDPARWTKGSFARNSDLVPCTSNDPFARSWCLLGAVLLIYDDKYYATVIRPLIMNYLDTHYPSGNWKKLGPTAWNDTPGRTHKDVLKLCRDLNI